MQVFIPLCAKLGYVMLVLVFATVFGAEAQAGPNCQKKPDHPSCEGGGGEEPPPESNPAIVYSAGLNGGADLYVMTADGTAPTLVMQGRSAKGRSSGISYRHGTWSPIGDKLAFHERAEQNAVLIRDLNDGQITPLFSGTSDIEEPLNHMAWHPSGDWVAFGVFNWVDDNVDIHIASAAGGAVENITSSLLPHSLGIGWEMSPSWSPEGTMLVFARWIDPNNSVHQLIICDFTSDGGPALSCDVDTEGQPVPWRQSDRLESPAWHPTDNLIAYIWDTYTAEGGYTDSDLIIASPDNTVCIHVRAADSPNEMPGCDVLNVDAIAFDDDVAWSCDGKDLLVTGVLEASSSKRGIYRIADVLNAQGSAPVSLLRGTEGKQAGLFEASSTSSCPN